MACLESPFIPQSSVDLFAQRANRENSELVGMRKQANMAQGVAQRVETLQLDRLVNLDYIARLYSVVCTAGLTAPRPIAT